MAGNPAPPGAALDAARTIAGQLTLLAKAQPAGLDYVRLGNGCQGGFARDFVTADSERVMVAALTRQQFADLAKATRLARTFAFLESVLSADFSACCDLYTHRAAIALLLAPWFSRRTVADLAVAFAGTSVPWACCTTSPANRGPDAEVAGNEMPTDRGMRIRSGSTPSRGVAQRSLRCRQG
jgi:crotonobetainyl-CoA:carnitine CoA-transferase CaiB-like acyl-CoA transferase